jgi:hypothetical protein
MPFTFAHPAAILPIRTKLKRFISLPALVVGSLVPDAAYYLAMPDNYKEGAHSWLGAIYLGLPVGVGVLLAFYCFAPAVTLLLPSPHCEVLQPKLRTPELSVSSFLSAACGIAIGAELHIAWDSFTHPTGWVVQRISLLREPLWGTRVHLYSLLEVLSSVVGLFVLMYVYDRWTAARGFRIWTWQGPRWKTYMWPAVLTACLVEAVLETHTIRAITSLSFLHHWHFFLILTTSFVRDFIFAVCALSLVVKRGKAIAGRKSAASCRR